MTRSRSFVLSLQVTCVLFAYAVWLSSQALLEKSRGLVPGYIDYAHQALAGVNAFLNVHTSLTNVVLAMSSFEVDFAVLSMIWRNPGFPSLIVTYSASSDFFFSGHMLVAMILAAELTVQGAPPWKQALAWAATGIQSFVVLSMRFHYVTDVATGVLAAIVAVQVANHIGSWVDERFRPWGLAESPLVCRVRSAGR